MIEKNKTLPGRSEKLEITGIHYVKGNSIKAPFPDSCKQVIFGMGCFWGAEKVFWQLEGVYTTAVGYIAGDTPNPTYREVCSGLTNHNEAVLVIFDSSIITLDNMLKTFWTSHNPTQGMRQGNDRGTQYRSGIYVSNEADITMALQSKSHYQIQLNKEGYGLITTEIMKAPTFYYAEEYHQQYLAKNPGGYCGLGGTGVCYN
jgi:peptide-methionine (S)-S-oxide reductase